ncbi:hypothetical protein F383_28998 [Gossypium arboreum]|uniref:Uncharacterized protein n=1 Tax=Gossypium arboreum TaxID=29729 RepID=A0A0B0PHB0_GOSAR|nr:hypothetical protein F383_28998 [Gossypium arboreum]
MSGTLALYCD